MSALRSSPRRAASRAIVSSDVAPSGTRMGATRGTGPERLADQPPDRSTEQLWRAFSKPLHGYLRKRTTSAADADDLLQEVFLRIHRQLPTLRDTSKLQGWVYRIARNAIIDRARAARATPPMDVDLELADEEADPSGRDAVDLAPTLRRMIAHLPPIYRESLILHEFQGQPVQAVAQALGVSVTAAKSRVRRARMLLRKELDACCRFAFDRRGRVIDAVPRASCACDPAECARG